MTANTTPTDVGLAAVRGYCDAATAGPWWVTENLDPGDPDAAVGVAAGWDGDTYTSMVVTTPGSGSFDSGEPTNRVADAEFIARARTDLPAVLDLCESQQREIERLTAENEQWQDRDYHAWRERLALKEALAEVTHEYQPAAGGDCGWTGQRGERRRCDRPPGALCHRTPHAVLAGSGGSPRGNPKEASDE